MTLTSHIAELRRKHQVLSEAVEAAQRAPATDALSLAQMKKRKLMLKEQIHRLQTQ
jgi:hypothetical protein